MKNIACAFLLIGYSCFILCGSPTTPKVAIEQVPATKELPSSNIHRIFQDKEGYIWFGTEDRIYRYDGYAFRPFNNNIHSPQLLTNNPVLSIAEDRENRLWFGTEEGILLLDKNTYEITTLDFPPLKRIRINSLLAASDGKVWIGTQNGLYKYDPQTTEITAFHGNDDIHSLPANGISYIYEDRQKRIWIALWDNGLCRYIPEKNHFLRYPPIGSRNNPFRIFQDKNGNYWIGCWGNGLFRFFPEAAPTDMYKNIKVRKQPGQPDEEIFFSIQQDDKFGYIWLVSFTGVFAIDNDATHTPDETETRIVFSSTNNLFNEITKDRNGNFWIGSYGDGAYTINFNKPEIKIYTLDDIGRLYGVTPSVTAIYEDPQEMIWLSLKRIGLCCFDKNNCALVHRPDIERIRKIIPPEDINIIKQIKGKNEIWISCDNDRHIYALKKNDRDEYRLHRKIDLGIAREFETAGVRFIRDLYEDRFGNVWVGTQKGLLVIEPDNSVRRPVRTPDNITCLTEDPSGNLWVASDKKGIFRLSPDGKKTENSFNKENGNLGSNNIQSVHSLSSGEIWAGSWEGDIYIYDRTKKAFRKYRNPYLTSGEPLLDITADREQHIWISTNKRIIEIDPQQNSTVVYSSSDGLPVNPFIKGACLKNKEGKIYFGGNKGFCSFPGARSDDAPLAIPPVKITDIRLQNLSIYQTPYRKNLDLSRNTLILEPNQTNIEIDFSSLNYLSASKIQYAYKMEGIDKEWTLMTGDRHFANYNNLQKGNYTFSIRASNENGQWDHSITQLEIYRKPHFYETWWAYTGYAVTFILLLYYIYRIFINRIKLENRLRIAQIEKRSSEELVQTKLKYFTNISHELLTPLTIISCLIDDLGKNSAGGLWQLNTMKSNIDRLKRLLQQILDFRKAESGNMKLKIMYGNLTAFIKEICYHNFSPLIKEKEIQFGFSSDPAKIDAWFDADKIDKILFNLLSNAFKYTGKGGSIQVKLDTLQMNGHTYVHIIVSDTGKGIPADMLPNIFTRFYHQPQYKSVEGNGIGLSLTKDLVEIHHGTIKVESQINAGTLFIISLPIEKDLYSEKDILPDVSSPLAPRQEISLDPAETVSLPAAPHTPKDIKLLVVEDNADLRIILERILSRNYEVYSAENGKQALELIAAHDIDIVISDVMMPEMDGLELCDTLKKNESTSHIAVLLLTAKNSIDDRVACYNAGADGYLSKPFEQKILEARLNSLVKNKKEKQELFRSSQEMNLSQLACSGHEEKFLKKAVDIIESDFLADSDFDSNALADQMNISRSTLYRKIKALTSLSPADFIRNIRLKNACRMLKDPSLSVKDVAYAVGFTDPRYFSSCFKNEFSMTPSEFRNRKQKDPVSPVL